MNEAHSYLTLVGKAIMDGIKSGTREFFSPTVGLGRWIGKLLKRLCN